MSHHTQPLLSIYGDRFKSQLSSSFPFSILRCWKVLARGEVEPFDQLVFAGTVSKESTNFRICYLLTWSLGGQSNRDSLLVQQVLSVPAKIPGWLFSLYQFCVFMYHMKIFLLLQNSFFLLLYEDRTLYIWFIALSSVAL